MAHILKDDKGQAVKRNEQEVHVSDYMQMIKSVDLEKRKLIMVGTDETRDRDGDIIRVKGWDIKDYMKNPVFLWAHNYSSVPIAAAEKVMKKYQPMPHMVFHLAFPPEGLFPFADLILELYGLKIINASSVGFIPKEWQDFDEDEMEEVDRNQKWGRDFIRQELLELSGCPVPCNPSALQTSMKGMDTFPYNMAEMEKYLLKPGTELPEPTDVDEVEGFIDCVGGECKLEEETVIQIQVPEQIGHYGETTSASDPNDEHVKTGADEGYIPPGEEPETIIAEQEIEMLKTKLLVAKKEIKDLKAKLASVETLEATVTEVKPDKEMIRRTVVEFMTDLSPKEFRDLMSSGILRRGSSTYDALFSQDGNEEVVKPEIKAAVKQDSRKVRRLTQAVRGLLTEVRELKKEIER